MKERRTYSANSKKNNGCARRWQLSEPSRRPLLVITSTTIYENARRAACLARSRCSLSILPISIGVNEASTSLRTQDPKLEEIATPFSDLENFGSLQLEGAFDCGRQACHWLPPLWSDTKNGLTSYIPAAVIGNLAIVTRKVQSTAEGGSAKRTCYCSFLPSFLYWS